MVKFQDWRVSVCSYGRIQVLRPNSFPQKTLPLIKSLLEMTFKCYSKKCNQPSSVTLEVDCHTFQYNCHKLSCGINTRKLSAKNVRKRKITARGGERYWYLIKESSVLGAFHSILKYPGNLWSLNDESQCLTFQCVICLWKFFYISVLHFQTRISAFQRVSDFAIMFTTPTATISLKKV